MSSAAVSDGELIARVLVQDDRHAFGELVRRHQSAVRACLRKLTGGQPRARRRSSPGDVLARLPQPALVSPTGQVLDLAVPDRLQRLPRRAAQDQGDCSSRTTRSGDEAHCRARAAAPVARSVALCGRSGARHGGLSEGERAAIVQCYHNDLSHEEAAFVLGCPVGTVKTHILRAKQKLKARLGAWAPEG